MATRPLDLHAAHIHVYDMKGKFKSCVIIQTLNKSVMWAVRLSTKGNKSQAQNEKTNLDLISQTTVARAEIWIISDIQSAALERSKRHQTRVNLTEKTPADAVNGLVFIPGRLQATSVLKLFPVTPPQSCMLSKLRLNVSNLIYYHRSIGSFLGERCTHCVISHDYSSHKQTFSNGPGNDATLFFNNNMCL